MDATRQPRSEAGRPWLVAVLVVIVSIGAMVLCTRHEGATSDRAADVGSRSAQRHVALDIATGRVQLRATASGVGAHREPRTRTAPADSTIASWVPTVQSARFEDLDIDPVVLSSSGCDIATSPRAPPLTTPSLSH